MVYESYFVNLRVEDSVMYVNQILLVKYSHVLWPKAGADRKQCREGVRRQT